MGDIAERLQAVARKAIDELDLSGAFAADEPCSCDQALDLRAKLAQAAAGSLALHVVKADGVWTVERWRDGVLVESYVGVPSIADAMDRVGDWMRSS